MLPFKSNAFGISTSTYGCNFSSASSEGNAFGGSQQESGGSNVPPPKQNSCQSLASLPAVSSVLLRHECGSGDQDSLIALSSTEGDDQASLVLAPTKLRSWHWLIQVFDEITLGITRVRMSESIE